MEQDSKAYAMNEDKAEKAGGFSEKLLGTKTGPEDDMDNRSATAELKTPKKEDPKPRPNAKIWSLYLEEAEKDAKELAENWKNGLESLLVFAGLFAGVVASFVIDSRHDLQPDPQQVLLTEIRNALRNETAPQDVFTPSTSALWINGLWFASFIITLFSAILGVLAKSWVVDFIPADRGQESADAYRRWIRDNKAELWHLESVIATAPLLIQIALFLFLIGFGLQSVGDHSKIGWTVLGLVLVVIALYFVLTFLPLSNPLCPLKTPLSAILPGMISGITALRQRAHQKISENRTRIRLMRQNRPNENDVLSDIWHRQLTQPVKTSNVDEAIAELTRAKLSDEWWERFVEWRAPTILHTRLQECAKYFWAQRKSGYEVLNNHLFALLGFVDYFERSGNVKLGEILGTFLGPGNPLYRWNICPEQTRALAFSARTPIMLACNKDYAASEMEERPWETIIHNMLPDHRRHFSMAACRGLAGEQVKLRKVSALSIVVCIARATATAIGPRSEWAVEIKNKRDEAETLGRKYLAKLFEEIANGWKMSILDASPSVTVNSESWSVAVLDGLGSQLNHPDPKIRIRTIEILGTLATDNDFGDAIKSSIPELFEIAATDLNRDARSAAIKTLVNLVRDGKFRSDIESALLESLSQGLPRAHNHMSSLDGLVTLVQSLSLQDTVDQKMSKLAEVAMSNLDLDCRIVRMKRLSLLARSGPLQDTVFPGLLKIIEIALDDIPSSAYLSWIEILLSLARPMTVSNALNNYDTIPPLLQDSIKSAVSTLLKMTMIATDVDVRAAGMEALAQLTVDVSLLNSIQLSLPNDLESTLQNPDWEVRVCTLNTLAELIRNHNLQDSASIVIPELVRIAVNDDDDDVHAAGIKSLIALTQSFDIVIPSLQDNLELAFKEAGGRHRARIVATLTQNHNFRRIVGPQIPKLVTMAVNDDVADVQEAGAKLLVSLVQEPNDELRDVIRPVVSNILNSPKDFNWRVRVVWFEMLTVLANTPEFQSSVESALPEFVDVATNDTDEDVRAAGMRSLATIARNDQYRSIIEQEGSLTKLINSAAKDPIWEIRVAWADIQVILAQIPHFQASIESRMQELVEMATKDDDEDVYAAGLKSLVALVQEDKIRATSPMAQSVIKSTLPRSLDSALTEGPGVNWRMRIAWIDALVTLSHDPDFRDSLQSAIPKLIKIAGSDDDSDVRGAALKTLTCLLKDDKLDKKLQDTITAALLKSLNSVFNDFGLHAGWSNILDTLIHRDARLGGATEATLPKIIEVAIQGNDKDARLSMVNLLVFLTKEDAKLRDSTKPILSKQLNSTLGSADWELRLRAVETLGTLSPHPNFHSTIKSAMPQLLRMAVKDYDDDVRQVAGNLLNSLRTQDNKETGDYFGNAIILAIPPAVTLIAQEGSEIRQTISSLLPLAGELTDREIMKSMAHILTPMLKEDSWLARATAVEFVAVLNEIVYFQQFTQSLVPEIITIALEDKEDGVRAAGIRSLTSFVVGDTLRDKIKAALPQFMQLLEVSYLRDPVVELISSLAVDDIVRKDIVSCIIDPLTQSETGRYGDGLLNLVSRLIVDKRFNYQNASDHVALFVVSVLLMQPHTTSFRFQTAIALWCNYGTVYATFNYSELPEDLVELFLFTVFGRHVTPEEVNKWCSMESYLSSRV